MQLTNSATIVDYFPEAFVAEACDIKGVKVVIKRFIKRVTFRANGHEIIQRDCCNRSKV